MLDREAVERLQNEFGRSEFKAREAVETLDQSPGSVFVRLSRMTKSGLLERIEKGRYRVVTEASNPSFLPATQWYNESKVSELGGYATATYALSSAIMGHAPVTYIDFFLPVRQALAIENRYADEFERYRPVPRIHPFAHNRVSSHESSDGIRVVSPIRAFLDLLLIIDRRQRPVSLGYEIIPFLEELKPHWPSVCSHAKNEGTSRLLVAIFCYIRMVSKNTDVEPYAANVLPKLEAIRFKYRCPQIADLGGREDFDSILDTIQRRTAIVLMADRQEALSVMRNI